jgi:hypothetical protein
LYVLTLAAMVAITSPLVAQVRNGNLFLTVTDERDATLEGVQVVLAGSDFSRTVNTDAEGKARFVEVVPGRYDLTLSNRGFNTMILQGVQIDAGANASFDVKLQRSELVEEVVVTARTPLLDQRKMGTETIFTKSEIEKVPTARDPWSVITTIPGVTSDRVNVAGSEAGQQAQFVGKGDDGNQTVWMMDGVEFTDIAAIGGSSTYLDFNAFEQIGFATAGADFEAQTPGVQLEFVTKQGSNRHTGTARLIYAESQFQTENSEGLSQPDWIDPDTPLSGNKVNEIFEKNFDLGGPLIRDKLWYWFGFTQNDINVALITGQPDETKLRNVSFKIHGQAGGKTTYKAFYTDGEKIKEGRGGGIDRPPETTWTQEGPTPIYGGSVSHFFTPDLEVTLQASSVEGGFGFIPGGDFSQQIFQDSAGVFSRTFSIYETARPQDQFMVKGNYFFDTGSWDHELKFGFRYKTAAVNSFSKYSEADMIATKAYEPNYVYLYRELNTSVDHEYTNAWIGDTVLKGPWTINAGLHFSQQSGEQAPSTANPNGTFPTVIQGLDFDGFDPGFTWRDISPRLGVTYTFDWEKRLLLRASYGSYVDQLGTAVLSYNLPLTYVGVAYGWNDLNDDDWVDQGELYAVDGAGNFTTPVDTTSDATACVDALGWFNIDPCDTGAASSPFQIDSNLDAPKVNEFIVGAEYEVLKDFTIAAAFTMREKDRLIWTPLYNDTVFQAEGRLETLAGSSIYDCTPTTTGTAPDGREWTENYCAIDDYTDLHPGLARWETNMPGYKQSYKGLELTATKRLSNKWMLRGFFSYADWTNSFSGEALSPGIYGLGATTQSGDPTNFRGGTTDDGGSIAVQSLSSGNKRDVFVGSSRWQMNINGMYQLPMGWSISGNLYGREGYGIPYHANVSVPGEGTKNVQVEGVDTVRYDDLYMLDLRAAKLFTLEGNTTVEVAIEGFNITNENTTLQINNRMDNDETYNRIGEILSPRIYRFMFTVNF